MDYKEIAGQIIEKVGGNENIVGHMNCMTRLRIEVVSKDKVDRQGLEQIESVKGISFVGTIVQVVLTDALEGVYREFAKQVVITAEKKKEGIGTRLLNFASSVFVPIIPALIGTGLLIGIVTLLDNMHWIDTSGTTFQFLNTLAYTALYFYPVLIAFSAARHLGCNPYLAVVIALFLCHPSYQAIVDTGAEYVSYLGLPVRLNTYTNTVFPMLLCIWGIYYVEKLVNRVVPDLLRTAVAPLIIIVLSSVLCLVVLAPLGSYVNIGFSAFFSWFYETVPVLAGTLIGAVASLLVLTGLHMILVVLALGNLSAFGYDVIFPILVLSTVILGSISLGAALRVKNKADRGICLSSALMGIVFGISEPALYGVVIRYKKPLVPMVACGAVVGVLSMVLGVKTTVVGGNGVFTFPGMALAPVPFAVCFVLALVLPAVATYVYGLSED